MGIMTFKSLINMIIIIKKEKEIGRSQELLEEEIQSKKWWMSVF
jgi:hypothetical protein